MDHCSQPRPPDVLVAADTLLDNVSSTPRSSEDTFVDRDATGWPEESEESSSGSGNTTLSFAATRCYGDAIDRSSDPHNGGQASAEADFVLPFMTSVVPADLRDQAILVHSQSDDEDNMPLLHLINAADSTAPSSLLMLVILTCVPHAWLVWWPLQTSTVIIFITDRGWRKLRKSLRRLLSGRVVSSVSLAPKHRPAHHFAGVRVGEAKNPGPGVLRQAALSFVPGQPSHALNYNPEATVTFTSGATNVVSPHALATEDHAPATASDNTTGYTDDVPMGESIPYPAEAGGSAGSHDRGIGSSLDTTKGLPSALNKLPIVLSTGDKLSLNCIRLKNGSFQWKFSSGAKRCAKTGHATRGEVLRAWLDDYRPMLASASVQEVMDFIKLIEGEATPPMVCPPPPTVIEHPEESVCEEVPLWRAPPDTDLAQISITIDQLMAP
eukprot:116941-Amphidinium_carterae.1